MKAKIVFIKIRSFLKNNKIWFETIAATLLGLMAIIVSTLQFGISSEQTNLLEKQTHLSKIQTQLANEQLLRSRITDSIQIEISKKQQQYLEIQTSFLYTPNLKVEFSGVFDEESNIILKNEGKKEIRNIRIKNLLGYYRHYDATFELKGSSMKDWKHIALIKSGESIQIPLDTGKFNVDINNLQLERRMADEGGVLDIGYQYLLEIIECFIVSYKSGPDLKEYSLKKFLKVDRNFGDKKLMILDLDYYLFDMKRVSAIKSIKFD